MMKPATNVEGMTLLLAWIHHKMGHIRIRDKTTFALAKMFLLPDDLLHLPVNSPNHRTQAWNSIISVF